MKQQRSDVGHKVGAQHLRAERLCTCGNQQIIRFDHLESQRRQYDLTTIALTSIPAEAWRESLPAA
jgi:hypothetical protein